MKKRNTLLAPTAVSVGGMEFEYSVHKVSAGLWPELSPSLPEVGDADYKKLLVVPTFQRCRCPVIEFTKEAADEKDLLLENFLKFVEPIFDSIRSQGHWCDYVDPTSGYTSVRGSSPYCESTAAECLLPYTLTHVGTSAGGCNMITHPRFGLQCYPATLFATCPVEMFTAAVEESWQAFTTEG